MANDLYRKPILFAVVALLAVLGGTLVTMVWPLTRADMHPKLENLRAFTPLELAGRDIYQREGCSNCHTQTVRPLQSEVLRYGEYSKAGEFAYDRPFLWGSKRTGPDLAREGGKRPDAWHAQHFANPQQFEPKSNMPRYAFLAQAKLEPAAVRAHHVALAAVSPGMTATDADFAALADQTEMDALVAYMQWLGHAVRRVSPGAQYDLTASNPRAADPAAIAHGHDVYAENCAPCHGDDGQGDPDLGPSIVDDRFLGVQGDMPDGAYFALIAGGSDIKPLLGRPGLADGGMAAYEGQISAADIWAVISWMRAQRAHVKEETP